MEIDAAIGLVSHGIMGTPREGLAAIFGAQVGIIAVSFRAGNAISVLAKISGGARITIFAGGFVVGEDAADLRITAIVRTGIGVVTGESNSTSASPVQTDRIHGTRVPVIAGALGIDCHAPQLQLAKILGAAIAVVALKQTAASAESGITMVQHSANVIVIAIGRIGDKGAPRLGVARVVSAWIGIVTGQRTTADALPEVTMVTGCADATVIAWRRIEAVDTTGGRVTAIIGAQVVVIALRQPTVDTGPRIAVVPHRAGVAIAARGLVGHVLTQAGIIATVVRTGILVVAVV